MTTGLDTLLARHPFCQGMAPEHMALMAGCATNVRFAAGDYVFRNGDEADSAYLIRSGRVNYIVHGQETHETAEAGDLMGWSWLFSPYRWHFDARAAQPLRVIELHGDCLRDKCDANPAFGYALTRRILFQVHRRLERSRLQAMDVYGRPR